MDQIFTVSVSDREIREIYIPRKIPRIRYLDVNSRPLCDVMLLLTKAIILQYNMVRAQNNSRTIGHFPEKNTVCQGIFKFVWKMYGDASAN